MNSLADKFKIRASMLSLIMTNPRTKSEELSKTCISYLEQRVKEELYWRKKDLSSVDSIAKGIECENEAIFVLNKALWTAYKKAVYASWECMDNGYCTGHEDIDWGDHTVDTKVCINFDTFPLFEQDADNAYYWQWQAYMRLKGENYKKHTIAKVLVNTPVWMLEQKLYFLYTNLCRKYNDTMEFVDIEYEERAKSIFLNNVFDQQITINSNGLLLQLSEDQMIPYEKRVHLTTIERNEADIAKIQERVEQCRDYLRKLWY